MTDTIGLPVAVTVHPADILDRDGAVPQLAKPMDHAEPDVLAYVTFAAQHRTKLHSTNPIERLNGELERRTPPRSAERVSCGDRIEGLLAFDSRRHLPQRGRHH